MEGRVSKIVEVDYQGTMLYSFSIEGDNGLWRCGTNKPDIKEGQWVSFTANGRNVTSIDTTGTEEPEPTSSKPVATASETGARIKYQAARRDACNLVVAALHTDHLPHAANVAKGKRLALLEGYVEQVTKTLLEQEDRNV